MKLYLLDIEKLLFPEFYPYYTQSFKAESDFIIQKGLSDDNDYLNIAFKVKLVGLSMKIKNPEVRTCIYYLYEKLFSNTFCYDTAYDWRDLKALLCFFVLFKDVKSFKELEKRAKKTQTSLLIRKYYHASSNLRTA